MQHQVYRNQAIGFVFICLIHAYYSYLNIFTSKPRILRPSYSIFNHDQKSMSLINNKPAEEDKLLANHTYYEQKIDEDEGVDPMVLKLFPKNAVLDRRRDTSQLTDEELENLKVDDPIFLDMDWPNEAGPRAKAFARHMAWRRQLADVERKFSSIANFSP
jgi:hypothetical protein